MTKSKLRVLTLAITTMVSMATLGYVAMLWPSSHVTLAMIVVAVMAGLAAWIRRDGEYEADTAIMAMAAIVMMNLFWEMNDFLDYVTVGLGIMSILGMGLMPARVMTLLIIGVINIIVISTFWPMAVAVSVVIMTLFVMNSDALSKYTPNVINALVGVTVLARISMLTFATYQAADSFDRAHHMIAVAPQSYGSSTGVIVAFAVALLAAIVFGGVDGMKSRSSRNDYSGGNTPVYGDHSQGWNPLINPSTGQPMVSGTMGGVDVSGHTWGN